MQKLNWPTWAIDALQEVVVLMKKFEDKVVDVERLCNKTLQVQHIVTLLFNVLL